MAENQDIRWLQRYGSFKNAFARLESVVNSGIMPDDLSDLEKSGLIKWFEFTYELAWKVLQDLLSYKGYDFEKGPNGTLRMALQDGLLDDQDGWREMGKARNLSTHTYDEDEAKYIVDRIYTGFYQLFVKLNVKLREEAKNYE